MGFLDDLVKGTSAFIKATGEGVEFFNNHIGKPLIIGTCKNIMEKVEQGKMLTPEEFKFLVDAKKLHDDGAL